MSSIKRIIVLAFATACLCSLAACRQEEQKKPPPANAVVAGEMQPRRKNPEQKQTCPDVSKETIIADKKTKEDDADKKFLEDVRLKQIEEDKAIVFEVPLNDVASREREAAWERLTAKKSSIPLSGEQCLYAHKLIDRYKNSSTLEKLVFWRLIYLRMYEQGASATSRILDDYQQIRDVMPKDLNGLLYSAINQKPDKMPIYPATIKGIQLLKQAGKKNQDD